MSLHLAGSIPDENLQITRKNLSRLPVDGTSADGLSSILDSVEWEGFASVTRSQWS